MEILKHKAGTIAYEQRGTGSQSIVLLHGCGLDHTSLAQQARYFAKSFSVISVDLRGHGNSRSSMPPYVPESMADDVAEVIQKLGLKQSVVVGHSMGGNVALTLHHRHPHLVSAIVLIDSAIFIPEVQRDKLRSDFAASLSEENALSFYKQALRSMCLPNEDLSHRVIDNLEIAPIVLTAALVAHTIDFDSRAVTSDCKSPLAYIHSTMPFVNIDALRNACPQLAYGQTLGSGHLSPQEVPEQVNAMIDTFLQTRTS